MREGRKLPAKIANAPELRMGLELYYDAFRELTTCRASGWSLGPIPWLAMREYAVAFQFSEEQSNWLYYLVRQMDEAYRDHHAPKKGKAGVKGSKWRPPKTWGN